jgi:exopolyphosphatase/guanosine-5'-triphosphate,3'-diphosphate pyrophosphatase
VDYFALPREDRLVILKLAAILRVADALDRGHAQKVRNLRLERREEEIRIHCDYTVDVAPERFSLIDKADMFEEVFGFKVTLT